MASWPDTQTAEQYIGHVDVSGLSFVEDCLDAAIDYLTQRVCLETTTNSNGDEEPVVPAAVAEAALILTGRLFRRRDAPNDFAVGEGGAVFVGPLLEGIETLISPYRAWGIA